MTGVALTPAATTPDQLEDLFRTCTAARLDRSAKPAVDEAHHSVAEAAAGEVVVYGINTGFGKLASVGIAARRH